MFVNAQHARAACMPDLPRYVSLPIPTDELPTYYLHVEEWTKKVKDDLKAAGCWVADPRASLGVQASSVAPSQSFTATNMRMVRRTWHRWDADIAPMPNGTRALWRDMLEKGEFTWTNDKAVLWDPASWIWHNPTWFISGVSVQKTKMAFLGSN